MLKNRLRIISLIKKRDIRYLKKTHKFGIEVPKSVYQAYALYKNYSNTLWEDYITKEMKCVSPIFRKLDSGEIVPIGYYRVKCHIIFGVKMEYFRCKDSLVEGENLTDPLSIITYTSVLSRETVRIALSLITLNHFPVKVAEIRNDYIPAPVTEKIWTVPGPDFGKDSVRKAIVVREIYGLKIAGYAFLNHLDDCMHHLVFLPCLYKIDLWMKPMVRPDDGFNYYVYLLIYVDDVMVIHHET